MLYYTSLQEVVNYIAKSQVVCTMSFNRIFFECTVVTYLHAVMHTY